MLGYLQVCYKNKYITLQIDSEDISVKSKTKRTSQEEIQKKKNSRTSNQRHTELDIF